MAAQSARFAEAPTRSPLPGWFRPVAYVTVAAIHAALLIGLNWPTDPEGAALPPIEVEVVPQGDPTRQAAPLGSEQASEMVSDASDARELKSTDAPTVAEEVSPEPATDPPRQIAELAPPELSPQSPIADVSQAAPPMDIVAEARPDELRPEPAQTFAVEPPLREVAEAESVPLPALREAPRPVTATRQAQPAPSAMRQAVQSDAREARRADDAAARRDAARREREAERRRDAAAEARERTAERATQARRAAAQAAARAGSARGGGGAASPSSGAVSTAAYGALVAAELNRRKRYPEAARGAGAQGVVTVSFVVGSSGRVASHAITRSSGHASLDGAVRQMMGSVALPPPPGGTFRASAPIRFSLGQ